MINNEKGCFSPSVLGLLFLLPILFFDKFPILSILLIVSVIIWVPVSIFLLLRKKK